MRTLMSMPHLHQGANQSSLRLTTSNAVQSLQSTFGTPDKGTHKCYGFYDYNMMQPETTDAKRHSAATTCKPA
ncbi:hypothetical protein R50076_05720 [Gilvimarinus japonicus]